MKSMESILLALWAILLFGGFLLGQPDADNAQRMPLWMRLASSAVLVLAAWSWYWVARGSAHATVALLVAVGMTLGLLGDLFMAQLIPVGQHVLAGMGAFGLGHVAYIAAFLLLGNQRGLDAPGPRWLAWGAWILIGIMGWYFAVYRGQSPTLLHWVALPYALLLASTAGFASGLGIQQARFWPLALGAALFLLSDLILAARLFNGLSFPLIGDVIWLTYGPGQALIVYGMGWQMDG